MPAATASPAQPDVHARDAFVADAQVHSARRRLRSARAWKRAASASRGEAASRLRWAAPARRPRSPPSDDARATRGRRREAPARRSATTRPTPAPRQHRDERMTSPRDRDPAARANRASSPSASATNGKASISIGKPIARLREEDGVRRHERELKGEQRQQRPASAHERDRRFPASASPITVSPNASATASMAPWCAANQAAWRTDEHTGPKDRPVEQADLGIEQALRLERDHPQRVARLEPGPLSDDRVGRLVGRVVRLVEHAPSGDVLEHLVERARVRPLGVRVRADERGDPAVIVGEVERAALPQMPDRPGRQHHQRRRQPRRRQQQRAAETQPQRQSRGRRQALPAGVLRGGVGDPPRVPVRK